MGDWTFGAHLSPPGTVAEAAAASAAVPYAIGALSMRVPESKSLALLDGLLVVCSGFVGYGL